MPQRRNAAFVAITPDLDLTEPPPPPLHPSRVSNTGIFQCFPSFHPEPQRVNIREPDHFSFCLFPSFVFESIHVFLSLHPHLPSHTNTHMYIPHYCEQKSLDYDTLTDFEGVSFVPASLFKSMWNIVWLVIINSCRKRETGTAASILRGLYSPYSCTQ